MSCRVLIADDHVLFREGLRALLERHGHEVVGEASTGQEANQLARDLQPEVVLLDLGMPVQNGIEAGREITAGCPRARMIALTVHTEEPYVLAALEAGFRGYALKSQAGSQLLQAIEEVSRGAVYLSPAVHGAVVDGYLGKTQLPRHPLTRREQQVLQLVAEGRSTKEIAALLGISPRTAESHRKRIKSKLQIHDTAGLVRYAVRQGIVEA